MIRIANACIYQYKGIKLSITRSLLTASQVTIAGLKNLPVQFRGSHASMLIPDVAEVAI